MNGLLRIQYNIRSQIIKDHEDVRSSELRTRSYYEVRLEWLETTWSKFVNTHYELLEMEQLTDECEYLVNNVYDEVKEVYFLYKSELKKYISAMTNIASTSSSTDSKREDELSKSIRLPEIEIPKFSGRYTEWPSFHDLFDSLINKNDQLPNIKKLFYLKTHITGDAEGLLRHIPITESNYERCWNLIKKRYCNKRYIANNVLNRLLNQENLSSENSNGIKQLLDTTNECLDALTNLKVDTSTWDILIIHLITHKLDKETRKLWEQRISNCIESLPSLQEFYIFLEERFRALEFLEIDKRTSIPDRSRKTHVFATTSLVCSYCEMSHSLDQCRLFRQQELDERFNYIKNNGLCYNCFGPDHRAFRCKHTNACQKCHRRHNTLLHREYQQTTSMCKHNDNKDSKEVQIPDGIVSTNFSNKASCPQVLLPTALVTVETKKASINLRALLDQGSQTSFITEKAVQFLGLRKLPIEGAITGVGGQSMSIKHAVKFKIQSTRTNFCCNVKAFVLNSISPSLYANNSIDITDWPELSYVKLADPLCGKTGRLDVLLGADVYGTILTQGIMRDVSGCLTAQATQLGWIVSGKVPVKPQYVKRTWRGNGNLMLIQYDLKA